MLIYLVLFLVILLLSMMNLLQENIGTNKRLMTAVSLLFFLFIGFRGAGYDYFSYLDIFQYLEDGVDFDLMEPGYVLLCNIAPTYRILLLCMALFTVTLHFSFIFKMSPIPYFSLMLLCATFLLPTFMGQMRQGVAIGFVIWAVYNIDNRWKFIALVLLGSLFHFSSLMALAILFLPKKMLSAKYYILFFILSFFASDIIYPIIQQQILSSQEGIIADKLYFYDQTEQYSLGFNTAILIRIIVLMSCYWRKEYIDNEYFPKIFNIYFLSIFLYLALGMIPQLGGRGTLYFSYFELILIPMVIMSFKGYNRLCIAGGFVLLSLLRYMQFFMDDFNIQEYVPYFKSYFI